MLGSRKTLLPSLLAAAYCACGTVPASAASYSFDVLYFGNGVESLAPGSDDPLSTTLQDGDHSPKA